MDLQIIVQRPVQLLPPVLLYPRRGMETMRFQRGHFVVVGERVKYYHVYFPYPLSLSKQTKELCILRDIV